MPPERLRINTFPNDSGHSIGQIADCPAGDDRIIEHDKYAAKSNPGPHPGGSRSDKFFEGADRPLSGGFPHDHFNHQHGNRPDNRSDEKGNKKWPTIIGSDHPGETPDITGPKSHTH